MNAWRIEFLGDSALLLRFGDAIGATVNRRVQACAAALRAGAPDWLIDITPAFASLALHVDTTGRASADPFAAARDWLEAWLANATLDEARCESRIVTIPVLYGSEAGPDLEDVAALSGISAAEAAARHVACQYTVAMLGFAPGFPYLLGLDPSLAAPRLASPRTRVAAGSLGIGGEQTGIYPQAGPGGWRLIGRTPLRLFDASRDRPSLLSAGDRVRFVAIDAATFDAMDEYSR